MSRTLPESMRCPECGDKNGASPNLDKWGAWQSINNKRRT